MTLSKEQAYAIASRWGSYIRSGDPGACFYSFPLNDGRPQSEDHRKACLQWIDNVCLPAARRDIELGKKYACQKRLEEGNRDVAELTALRTFFQTSEITTNPRNQTRALSAP